MSPPTMWDCDWTTGRPFEEGRKYPPVPQPAIPTTWAISQASKTRIIDVVSGALIADLTGLMDAEENAATMVYDHNHASR